MKICVVGAGAIGGMIAAKLSLSGEDVNVIDRSAHLEAIKRDGLTLRWQDGTVLNANVRACENAAEASKQDLIVQRHPRGDLAQSLGEFS